VIRRGFWFVTGAVAGVAGYRRVSRAARMLLPQADLLSPRGRPAIRFSRDGGSGQRAAAGTAGFVRDVRAGMTDYLEQHRGI
jgi:hypothetical protein